MDVLFWSRPVIFPLWASSSQSSQRHPIHLLSHLHSLCSPLLPDLWAHLFPFPVSQDPLLLSSILFLFLLPCFISCLTLTHPVCHDQSEAGGQCCHVTWMERPDWSSWLVELSPRGGVTERMFIYGDLLISPSNVLLFFHVFLNLRSRLVLVCGCCEMKEI